MDRKAQIMKSLVKFQKLLTKELNRTVTYKEIKSSMTFT